MKNSLLDAAGKLVVSVLPLILLATWSCASEPVDAPPIQWEGQYVIYRSDEASICEGELVKLDDEIKKIATFLNVPLGQEKIQYYLVPEDKIITFCGEEASACAYNGVVYTTKPVHTHELVHAIIGVDHYDLLNEGIAMAYSLDLALDEFLFLIDGWDELTHEVSITEMAATIRTHIAEHHKIQDYEYGPAAVFVAYLIGEYGKEKVLRIIKESKPGWSQRDLNIHFLEELDISFDDVLGQFAAQGDFCYPMPHCPQETVEWLGGTVASGAISFSNSLCVASQKKLDSEYLDLVDETVIEIREKGFYTICVSENGQDGCSPILYADRNDSNDLTYLESIFQDKGYLHIVKKWQWGPGCLYDYSLLPISPVGHEIRGIPINREVVLTLSPGRYVFTGRIGESVYTANNDVHITISAYDCQMGTDSMECDTQDVVSCENSCKVCFYDETRGCNVCECRVLPVGKHEIVK